MYTEWNLRWDASPLMDEESIRKRLTAERQEIVQWACRCLSAIVQGTTNVRPTKSIRSCKGLDQHLIIWLLRHTWPGSCSRSQLGRAPTARTL